MHCHECGADIRDGAKFCRQCGAEQPAGEEAAGRRDADVRENRDEGTARERRDDRPGGGRQAERADRGGRRGRSDDAASPSGAGQRSSTGPTGDRPQGAGQQSRTETAQDSRPRGGGGASSRDARQPQTDTDQRRGRSEGDTQRGRDDTTTRRGTGGQAAPGGRTEQAPGAPGGRGREASWADAEVFMKETGKLFRDGTIGNDILGHGTAFLLEDRLVFDPEGRGTLRTWFVFSVSESTIEEAAANPDVYVIPMESITAVQLEKIGFWGTKRNIVIESTELGTVKLQFGEGDLGNQEDWGEDVDLHEEFARRLREQAISQGADVSREETFEQPMALWKVGGLALYGVFAILFGLVAVQVRPVSGAIVLLTGLGAILWSFVRGAEHLGS